MSRSHPSLILFLNLPLFFLTKTAIAFYVKNSQILPYHMAQPNGIKTAESQSGLCAISVNVRSQVTFSMTHHHVAAWEHGPWSRAQAVGPNDQDPQTRPITNQLRGFGQFHQHHSLQYFIYDIVLTSTGLL